MKSPTPNLYSQQNTYEALHTIYFTFRCLYTLILHLNNEGNDNKDKDIIILYLDILKRRTCSRIILMLFTVCSLLFIRCESEIITIKLLIKLTVIIHQRQRAFLYSINPANWS